MVLHGRPASLAACATYAGISRERRESLQAIARAEYRDMLEGDIPDAAQLEAMDYCLLHMLVKRQPSVVTPGAFRNESAERLLQTRLSWLPSNLGKKSVVGHVQRQLQKHVDYLVGIETGMAFPATLHMEVKQGRLDAMETCKVLMSCLASRCRLLATHDKKLTTSRVPDVEAGKLQDVGFQLASISSTTQLMELFGLNPRTLARPPTDAEGLPRFFDPSLVDPPEAGQRSDVFRNFEKVTELLDVRGSRAWMLSFDETVMWPTWATYTDSRGRWFVGGADDLSRLACAEHSVDTLKKEDLAQSVLAFLATPGATLCMCCFGLANI